MSMKTNASGPFAPAVPAKHIYRNETNVECMPARRESAVTKELRAIRKELEYIRKHMVDADMLLTPAEAERLEKGLREFRDGKTRSLDEYMRDRGAV